MSDIWEKMGKPDAFCKGNWTQPTQHGNLWDLQPIARSMKPTLWVPSENVFLAPSRKREFHV